MDLPPDFRDLLEVLGAAGVEYAVIGGYAVAFHRRPRATKDLDILISGEGDNLARTAQALATFGPKARSNRSRRAAQTCAREGSDRRYRVRLESLSAGRSRQWHEARHPLEARASRHT